MDPLAIAAFADKQVSQCSQHYTIGLIIVDGIVNDVENLIDKLVDVGNLPLSIVVVGIVLSGACTMDRLCKCFNIDLPKTALTCSSCS